MSGISKGEKFLLDELNKTVSRLRSDGTLKTDPTKAIGKLELHGDKLRFTSTIYTPAKQSGFQLMNRTVKQAENAAFNRGMAVGGVITGITTLPFLLSD